MREKTIGVTRVSLEDLTPVSEERMEALRAIRDEDIDFSDISNQGGKVWRRVPTGALIDRERAEDTLKLDRDVVVMFRVSGRPMRMNAVLRNYAQAQRKNA